jgi:predicted ATP-grasp superfamily ATP-dependent carboligase/CelD/BcsL family acetyltransferase involved in cellulose biosynthesis
VGLTLTRSLGRHGISVWCVFDDNRLPSFSRYCRRELHWPGNDPEVRRDFLLELGSRGDLDGWVLYPTSDESAKALSQQYERLSERFRLAVAPWETFRVAYDKRATYEFVQKCEIPTPRLYHVSDVADLANVDCEFPVVLKPAVKEIVNEFTNGRAWLLRTRKELERAYERAAAMVPTDIILVQEHVPSGPENQFSFAALCQNGAVHAFVAAQRVHLHPDEFGVASYVRTIDSPELVRSGRDVVRALGLSGLVEMDFVRDTRNGVFNLLDVNPRPWGWHGLGRRAGVDFPYLYWELLNGRPGCERRGRAGATWRHLIPDLQRAFADIRDLDALAKYARTFTTRSEGAVAAIDDPLPALAEPVLLKVSRLRRARRSATRESARCDITLVPIESENVWNDALRQLNGATAFHEWRWLVTLAAQLGLQFVPMSASSATEVVGVIPLLVKRRGPFRIVNWLPFPYVGPLVRPEFTRACLTALSLWGAERRVVLCQASFAPGTIVDDHAFEGTGFVPAVDETLIVPAQSTQSAWSNLNSSARNKINRATRLGVTLQSLTSEGARQLPTLIAEAFARHGVETPYPASVGHAIAHAYRDDENARLVEARINDELVGFHITLLRNNTAYLWFAGTTDHGRSSGAGVALYWDAIDWSLSCGAALDLVGVPDEGIRRYKEQFGTKPASFTVARSTPIKGYLRMQRLSGQILASAHDLRRHAKSLRWS